MASVVTKTRNANLQRALENWVQLIDAALAEASGTPARKAKVLQFVETFVPKDVTADDIEHFSGLLEDEEYFVSMRRDINCCATGELVETIEGNQTARAVFIILPTPGTLSEGSSLDIVREVSFISTDRGASWTAEA